MNTTEARALYMRTALLLVPHRDMTDTYDIPATTVYVLGSSGSPDETDSFAGRFFMAGTKEWIWVNLRVGDLDRTWVWDGSSDTLLLSVGVVESIVRYCNDAFVASKTEEAKDALVSLWRVTQLVLGPDYDHSGEPIWEWLKGQRPPGI
jgi:hypothetical protein